MTFLEHFLVEKVCTPEGGGRGEGDKLVIRSRLWVLLDEYLERTAVIRGRARLFRIRYHFIECSSTEVASLANYYILATYGVDEGLRAQ